VKYVVTGGQTGPNATNTSLVVLDQSVTVP